MKFFALVLLLNVLVVAGVDSFVRAQNIVLPPTYGKQSERVEVSQRPDPIIRVLVVDLRNGKEYTTLAPQPVGQPQFLTLESKGKAIQAVRFLIDGVRGKLSAPTWSVSENSKTAKPLTAIQSRYYLTLPVANLPSQIYLWGKLNGKPMPRQVIRISRRPGMIDSGTALHLVLVTSPVVRK